MKLLLLAFLFVSSSVHAAFLFHYGLNYAGQKDGTSGSSYDNKRVFHKLTLGASVNQMKTLYFGWNINKWNSSSKDGPNQEHTYSVLEMGPKFVWFMNENYNWYFSGEWNPYARGDRNTAGQNQKITGSSYAVALGYRFRITKMMGLGASINYHNLSISEKKVSNTSTNVSDKVSNIMPMLEFSIITK